MLPGFMLRITLLMGNWTVNLKASSILTQTATWKATRTQTRTVNWKANWKQTHQSLRVT